MKPNSPPPTNKQPTTTTATITTTSVQALKSKFQDPQLLKSHSTPQLFHTKEKRSDTRSVFGWTDTLTANQQQQSQGTSPISTPVGTPTNNNLQHETEKEKQNSLEKKKITFSKQDDLPRLPIPSLDETLDKYLQTLRPLLSNDDFLRSSKVF